MTKIIYLLLLLPLILTSCAPRGESRSLDEVYNSAYENFVKASAVKLPAPVSGDIEQLKRHLEELLNADATQTKKTSADIAFKLTKLSRHAAYTNRPAMGELAQQFSTFAERKKNASAIKLLIARTYGILSSELETGRFRL